MATLNPKYFKLLFSFYYNKAKVKFYHHLTLHSYIFTYRKKDFVINQMNWNEFINKLKVQDKKEEKEVADEMIKMITGMIDADYEKEKELELSTLN